jgi:hypothetical protein
MNEIYFFSKSLCWLNLKSFITDILEVEGKIEVKKWCPLSWFSVEFLNPFNTMALQFSAFHQQVSVL